MVFCLCGIAWKNMVEFSRGGAYVPARVALQGCIHRSPPRTMHVFLVWKRRCADVRAGTQAPPLRISFGWIACGWLISFGVDCTWVVLFICWENGAHDPTPSVLYF